MKSVINGKGQDVGRSVLAWLSGQPTIQLATLYLIGEPDDPSSLWLTDWEAPLTWSWWGTFYNAVIKRGSVSSKAGFELSTLDVSWAPNNFAFSPDIKGTSPYQQAYLGKFDGATFRSWTVYMPTPGDANTFGASELFGGRIGDILVHRNEIKFTINSFLDVVNQEVPGSIVETLNTVAGFKGATPPTGLSQIPTFSVASSNTGLINANCLTPTPNQVFATNAFQGGFLSFTTGTLAGVSSAIETNVSFNPGGGGATQNQFTIYTRFPWNPSIGDQFYASSTYPINKADGTYFGFPFIPDPSNAL